MVGAFSMRVSEEFPFFIWVKNPRIQMCCFLVSYLLNGSNYIHLPSGEVEKYTKFF